MEGFIETVPGDETDVVRATDGYPIIFPPLAQSEAALAQILAADPLLIREYRSTKGVTAGNASLTTGHLSGCGWPD